GGLLKQGAAGRHQEALGHLVGGIVPWGRWQHESQARNPGVLEVPPAELAPGWGGKRSIVVADDAAFRERSKMLTAMERQKWLNSYMQKLLVVNPD
uniref:Tuberoinfundibular peptide of 39 residues n=1 Tax=Gopherus agassizii TaxID=38772 RepID=A0A452HL20_9SAUR